MVPIRGIEPKRRRELREIEPEKAKELMENA